MIRDSKGRFVKGTRNPFKGTKGILKPNKTSFKTGYTPWNKDKKAPQIAEAKLGKKRPNISGEKHWFWTGGTRYKISPTEWYIIRQLVLERDGFKCRECNKTHHEIRLDVHHIIPYRISKDNSLNNLITYCRSCHSKIEAICIKQYKEVNKMKEQRGDKNFN